jgi:hypothetical protein
MPPGGTEKPPAGTNKPPVGTNKPPAGTQPPTVTGAAGSFAVDAVAVAAGIFAAVF